MKLEFNYLSWWVVGGWVVGWVVVGENEITGCPTILYTLLFFEFLGFLGVQKFHLGHFSTAHFVQISKISNFLLFDEIYTEICPKYYREGNEKVNIFCLLLKLPLEHTGALISIQEHSGALQSAQESLIRAQEYSGALINTHNSTLPWWHEYS